MNSVLYFKPLDLKGGYSRAVVGNQPHEAFRFIKYLEWKMLNFVRNIKYTRNIILKLHIWLGVSIVWKLFTNGVIFARNGLFAKRYLYFNYTFLLTHLWIIKKKAIKLRLPEDETLTDRFVDPKNPKSVMTIVAIYVA